MQWLQQFAQSCESSFFGIRPWHQFLPKDGPPECNVQLENINGIWLAVAGVTQIALRLAGLLAIIFIIVGGITYITSRGEPEQTKRAASILINAVIGLVIAILASVIVGFVAGRFGG